MANADIPNGFSPVRYRSGAPYNGACNSYYKSASVILGVGDPVVRAADSADPAGGPSVTRATTGSYITGVVVGVPIKQSDLTQLHMAAADTGYVLVADDPDLIFEVQDNGGNSGLVVAQVGQHIDSVTALDADTSTGRSKYEIDTEAVATDNTWILEGLVNRPDNVVGANAKWLVSANLHTERNNGASDRKEI